MLALGTIAGRGGAGDRPESRRERSGRRPDPRSTSRSIPRARSSALGERTRRPPPAVHAQHEHLLPGARSSPRPRRGPPPARTPPAIPGRERTPLPGRPESRTPGRSPDPVRPGRNGGFGPGPLAAAESGCSVPPHHYPGSPQWSLTGTSPPQPRSDAPASDRFAVGLPGHSSAFGPVPDPAGQVFQAPHWACQHHTGGYRAADCSATHNVPTSHPVPLAAGRRSLRFHAAAARSGGPGLTGPNTLSPGE